MIPDAYNVFRLFLIQVTTEKGVKRKFGKAWGKKPPLLMNARIEFSSF